MFTVFKSSQPYQQIAYRNLLNDETQDKCITFLEGDHNDQFTCRDPVMIKALREYAERTKISYTVMELTAGCKVWEFLQKRKELEEKLISDVEAKEQKIIEQNKQREIYRAIRDRL